MTRRITLFLVILLFLFLAVLAGLVAFLRFANSTSLAANTHCADKPVLVHQISLPTEVFGPRERQLLRQFLEIQNRDSAKLGDEACQLDVHFANDQTELSAGLDLSVTRSRWNKYECYLERSFEGSHDYVTAQVFDCINFVKSTDHFRYWTIIRAGIRHYGIDDPYLIDSSSLLEPMIASQLQEVSQ